jgi:hypothetical protein
MAQQTTQHILMVRPASFAFNAETAANNAFQTNDGTLSPEQIKDLAKKEFDRFVRKLRKAGVNVIVARDSAKPAKPDAVFPNNWATYHENGLIVTYPMYAATRRLERRKPVINAAIKAGFVHKETLKLNAWENKGIYLEGTGSLIFDHQHRYMYACLSPRTQLPLLAKLSKQIGYQSVVFHSVDEKGQEIYHTNVMMALGETFVVICLDSVRDPIERALLLEKFKETGKEVIEITYAQMNQFAGNMLQVQGHEGQRVLVMSEQAYQSLTRAQVKRIKQHTAILHSAINTIETYGGGSARCMMAEVFMPTV